MTATATARATWTAPEIRLRQLQREKAELAIDLVPRPGSTLTDDARLHVAGRLLEIDDELIDVWAEIAENRERIGVRTPAEREADRSDHQHLCAEIVDQWRERKRLASHGVEVPAPECFRPGRGKGSPPLGLVWSAVRETWDALREGREIERRRAAEEER